VRIVDGTELVLECDGGAHGSGGRKHGEEKEEEE